MVKIVADTTAGLPEAYIREHRLAVLPQIVVFGEQSYRDDSELNSQAFLDKVLSSPVMPKTAAPPPALYCPIFEEYIRAGEAILVVAPTSDASGTYRSALTAAQDYPGADITVYDTRSVAGPLALMVSSAVAWAEAGEDVKTITSRLDGLVKRQRLYILVDTLDFLRRGGRIGGAAHLVGNLLQLKPLLSLSDGKIDALSKERTKGRALASLKERVLRECPPGRAGQLCVMHAGVEAEARELAEYFSKALELSEAPVYFVPPAVMVHAGPGALAVGFFAREGEANG